MAAKEKLKRDTDENGKLKEDRFLILHNDDYHTFDYVIDALIDVCGHEINQATQCTMLVHYKGQCDVKKGSFTYLSPMRKALVDRELKATID
ncbi:MAG: ATP-dependent Clp protease adaptor ClpS [Prolixibacteraceae bacterium]|jgi:ATP-dependent Clp protease adaptor protein ClpS|nr:ATP-dependent Clp protease adaptor ClpS [Prolixibacteraceae bacterium]